MISNDEVRALWNEARTGNEGAFVDLYRTLHRSVFRFALHLGGSEVIAEDVVQEVFLFLIRNADAFDPQRGSLRAFLLGVARNITMQLQRREKGFIEIHSEEEEMPQDPAPQVLSGLLRKERIQKLRKTIARLPQSYREVLALCDLEELSYEEAAGALGCAIGTVRSRLHRARGFLLLKLTEAEKQKGGTSYELPIVSGTCK